MSNDETVIAIGTRVWEMASANGRNIWRAADVVAKKLNKADRERLLVWACVQAERLALQRNRPVEGGGQDATGNHFDGAEPLNRRRLILHGQTPADYVLAIANTGERKRLGDLTRADINTLSRYAATIRDTYAAKATGWARISERVPEHGVLASVIADLTTRDREFLHQELGVAWEATA